MAKILLLETATSVCSVALSVNGKIVAAKEEIGLNLHASKLTLFIQEVLQSAQVNFNELNAVCISKGPGSYTGLRIGTSTAKGLCFALDIPLLAINTLEMMAMGFRTKNPNYKGLLCPMIDARRMEVYSTILDSDLKIIRPTEAKIIDGDSFSDFLAVQEIAFFGDGAAKCKAVIENKNATFYEDNFNSAGNMACMADKAVASKAFEDVAYFEPFYLKDFLVTTSKKNSL